MRGVKVRTTVAKKHRLNAKLKKQADEDQTHVHLGHYLAYVRTELDQEASCLEMPWTMILLLSFAVVMFMHLRPDQVLVVENAWKTDIEENANFAWSEHFGHKTVYDVDSIPDFWAWLRLGMLPLLGNTWLWSEGRLDAAYAATPFSTPDLPTVLDLSYGIFADEPWGNASLPVRGDFLHFNRIVAGVRLQQERAIGSWEACHVPTSMPEDLWKRWLGKPCMLATPSYFLRPEVHWAHSFHSPQRVEWMLSGSLQELQQMTLDMEDGAVPEVGPADVRPAKAELRRLEAHLCRLRGSMTTRRGSSSAQWRTTRTMGFFPR
ncbi:unnamed protein product [Effrenium voratum]|nr:unnamed protein product [Effrenium voratum]